MAVPVNPQYSLGDPDMPVQSTLFGSASSAIAPVFAPAGFDDWHIGAALITGFVAKESVVGTLATTYGLDEPEDPSQPSDLTSRLRDTFNETSGGHGAAAAIGFMVFCLVYTPCLVTVGEQRRLFGGKVTAASVVGSILLAWVLAVVIFQVGALLT
jgi:ferrous iron transport protein B